MQSRARDSITTSQGHSPYPFAYLGSVFLAVSPHKSFNPLLLLDSKAVGEAKKGLDTVQVLLSNNENVPELSDSCNIHSKHVPIPATMNKINSTLAKTNTIMQ